MNMREIYQNTVLLSDKYPFTIGEKIVIHNENQLLNKISSKTSISILNKDCIQECIDLSGNKICLLNLANNYMQSGCKYVDGNTQEEHIFRTTNINKSLVKKLYPWKDNEIVYTENVTIFKYMNYNLLPKPVNISVISVAALINSKKTKDGKQFLYEKHRKITYDKIGAIFDICYNRNVTHLILGGLGCGAFNNPKDEIADIFKFWLNKYKNCFKYISFCIYDTDETLLNIFRNRINN